MIEWSGGDNWKIAQWFNSDWTLWTFNLILAWKYDIKPGANDFITLIILLLNNKLSILKIELQLFYAYNT